jgi:hypothetical protein
MQRQARQKSPPKQVGAHRDKNPRNEWPKIPVETPCLASCRKRVDISPLAEFVSSVKTTLYSERELDLLAHWARRVPGKINIKGSSARHRRYEELGYYRHLDHPDRWRIRKAIEQILASATDLGSARLEAFGRCAALRVAQWALDGRKGLPTID